MELSQDFNEFIACCDVREVRYLIVGGYAVAAHGHPRFTKDLDVWIWVNPDNAARMIGALSDFGFSSLGLTEDDFLQKDAVVQLGHPPQRIDLLTGIDGVAFDDCWADRVPVRIGGRSINFLDRTHLILNKRASGRPQDLADVAALDGQGGTIN